jgi:hypothetical protein
MACVGEHRLTIWATKQQIKEIKIMTEILPTYLARYD